MAEAKLEKKELSPRKVIEAVVEEKVVLEMTMEEAQALHFVVRQVGGNPRTTPRGQIDSIFRALKVVPGIGYIYLPAEGSLFFKDGYKTD